MLRRIRTALLAVCLAGLCPAASAGSVEYGLELPENQRLSYAVEFEVAHPGRVVVDGSWDGTRVLVFRLERPARPPLRLAGPSPQRFEIDVEADEIVDDLPWTLTLSCLPSRQAASGRLRIELPDAQAAAAAQPPAPQPDPWRVAVEPPAGIGQERLQLYEANERFRLLVVEAEVPDTYRWQEGLLEYLARMRKGPAPEPASNLMLKRAVETIHSLDELRLAESDPLVRAPTDALGKRAWSNVRDRRFEPIEGELNALMTELHDGSAPQMGRELWFTNLLSCLIICEHHFEQRARLGEQQAVNADLVQRQWPVLLGAAGALEALHSLP